MGAGVCGALVARELARAGREVTLLERGAWVSHPDQLEHGAHGGPPATAQPNHEGHPSSRPYPWTYVYGVGGSTLAWAGVTPRFDHSDFRIRSEFGVGRDWPISYEDLEPYYAQAERELAVAGDGEGLVPHPFSPTDRLIAPYLPPYEALSQARPTRSVGGRPACTGLDRCEMCPIDARYSGLHTVSAALAERQGLQLRPETAVTRLHSTAGRVTGLDCVSSRGDRSRLSANTVVLAAGGIENPAVLLRSGLDGPDVGRWLSDHEHRILELELDVSAGHGHGATPATGMSRLYTDAATRSDRGAVVLLPVDPGIHVTVELLEGLVSGERGTKLRERLTERFDKTLVLDLTGEDLPRADRFMELSPTKDGLGMPLNRISFPPDSAYLKDAFDHVTTDLPHRLAPLGARMGRSFPRAGGAHLLGTCFMGESDGVVDAHMRHHEIANLYVAGGSAFPTCTAVHPTLTIAALALRLGQHLASAT